ncbi:MAG TPA: winged helix-turn-helix domain-containing protein [Phenylobacterium sp.]
MIYRFDPFEIDTGQVELRRGGARVAVEPQVFALLRLLVENRERMVSKDEIVEAVWQGRFISDSALSSRIKSARQALGDDGAAQRWIRTIHGQGFRFVGEVAAEPPAAAPAVRAPPPAADPTQRLESVMARPMVAVFPFEQEHPDPQDAYFVDGLAEDLMDELAAWQWLPILSRNAAFEPARRALPLPQRAAAAGARYAIGGRFHRLGAHARLSIELVDAASGAQLWSARFERTLDELVAMQGEIAAQVFARVAPELNTAERRRILRKPPEDLNAWDLTLKALWVLNQPSPGDFTAALSTLETAIRLDPAAALPWSLVSLIHYETALRGWVGAEGVGVLHHLRDMLAAAHRALEIDPREWRGHALASAGELYASGAYDRARHHADLAIELNPSAGLAHQFSGCVYGFGGDLEAAIAVQSQAFRVDPNYLHAEVIESDLGLWCFLLDDLDTARAHLDRALAANPGNLRARQRMAALLARQGQVDAARAQLTLLAQRGAPLTAAYVKASYPFQRPEHAARLVEALNLAGADLG